MQMSFKHIDLLLWFFSLAKTIAALGPLHKYFSYLHSPSIIFTGRCFCSFRSQFKNASFQARFMKINPKVVFPVLFNILHHFHSLHKYLNYFAKV